MRSSVSRMAPARDLLSAVELELELEPAWTGMSPLLPLTRSDLALHQLYKLKFKSNKLEKLISKNYNLS